MTAVVLTTSVETPVAIATLPEGAEAQTAGDTFELQFDDVFWVVITALPSVAELEERFPRIVVVAVALPILTALAVDEPMYNVPVDDVSIPEAGFILNKLLTNIACPKRPNVRVVAFDVPKSSAPEENVSMRDEKGRNRFPLVRVVFTPSSERRESPMVVVDSVNLVSLFIEPDPVIIGVEVATGGSGTPNS